MRQERNRAGLFALPAQGYRHQHAGFMRASRHDRTRHRPACRYTESRDYTLKIRVCRGAAKDIIVQLQGSHEKLTLSIVDDGVGFQIDGALKMGLGLISIRERAESLGGTLEITSTPGHGTRLYIAVPFVAQTQAKATATG